MLTSIVGLRWASTIIPFMEQEMIVEGEQIQSASEKFPTPVTHFFSIASMTDVTFGGLGGKGGTVDLGEGSVNRFLVGWIWIEEVSFPCWSSKQFEVLLRF
jgi:hypothetical protein